MGAAARRARVLARPLGRDGRRLRRAAVDLRPPQPRRPRTSPTSWAGPAAATWSPNWWPLGGAVGVRDLPRARRRCSATPDGASSGCARHVRRGAQAGARAAPGRDDPSRPRRRPGRADHQVGQPRRHRADRGRRRGRALLCGARPVHWHEARRSSPGRCVHGLLREPVRRARRAAGAARAAPRARCGARASRCWTSPSAGATSSSTGSRRGCSEHGAQTFRVAKEIFSKPADARDHPPRSPAAATWPWRRLAD